MASCDVGDHTAAADPAACSDALGDAEMPHPGYDGGAEYGGGGGSDDDGPGEYDHFDAPGQLSAPHVHLLTGCLATACLQSCEASSGPLHAQNLWPTVHVVHRLAC